MAEPWEPHPHPFGRVIDGSRGVVVFGNGVHALVGEVAHTGEDDYIIVEGNISGVFDQPPRTYAVPLASIVYYAFAREEETE